jgi:7-keto-8-aminopelargonate synthetase-like enzyme
MTVLLDAIESGKGVRGRVVANARIDAVLSAAEVESDGAKLIAAATDDVLGLGSDPRVREALNAAVRKFGVARATGARAVLDFEARLAGLLGVEQALVVGHEASVLPLLPTWRLVSHVRGVRTISDAVPATTPEEAEAALSHAGMIGLVVEALHLFEGDLAPTPRFAEACQRRHAGLVVIDDALGVLGPGGLGAVEHLSLQDQVDLRILPLGRAIPGSGAIVLGEPALLEVLRGALPPPSPASLAVSLKAMELAHAEAARRARAFDVAHRLLVGLKAVGFDTGPCVTPWVPIWLGDEALTRQWLEQLAAGGVLVRGFLSGPRSRLLLSCAATMTDDKVAQVVEAFERVARKLAFPEATPTHRAVPTLARPGSYAMAGPAPLHWSTVDLVDRSRPSADEAPAAPQSSIEALSIKARVLDAVETMTWRATSAGSTQLRRGADALRTLLDRRRR